MFGKKKQKKATEKQQINNQIGPERLHSDALGDVWAALTGQNPAAIMPQVVATVINSGGTRPPWQWQRQNDEFILMAWPEDQPVRAAVLLAGKKGEKLRPVTAVPLLEGLPNDFTVEDIVEKKAGLGADISVQVTEDRNPLWFFDPLFSRDKEDLTPGVTHTFWLAGVSLGIRRALLDHITITRGLQYEEYAEKWLNDNPEKTRLDVPPLKIDLRNKHIIMPGRHYGEYEMRGTIEKIEDCQFEKMPVKLLYMSFPLENRPPLHIALYASSFILKDYAPEEGHEIDAYVWLQGRIIDLPAEAAK